MGRYNPRTKPIADIDDSKINFERRISIISTFTLIFSFDCLINIKFIDPQRLNTIKLKKLLKPNRNLMKIQSKINLAKTNGAKSKLYDISMHNL